MSFRKLTATTTRDTLPLPSYHFAVLADSLTDWLFLRPAMGKKSFGPTF